MDTGSSISLIREDMVPASFIQVGHFPELTGINKSRLNIIECFVDEILVEGHFFKNKFCVVDEFTMGFKALLGSEILNFGGVQEISINKEGIVQLLKFMRYFLKII